MIRPLPSLVLALATLSMAACRRAEIKSQLVPKEIAESEVPAVPQARETSLGYVSPDTWQKLPADQMNVAKFSAGEGVLQTSINVTPLAGMNGREAMLVDMWRQMVQQPPLGEVEAQKTIGPMQIGQEQGSFFEVTGKSESGEMTILTAFLHREDKTWFFKLQGAPAAVQAQKAVFTDFLKTIQFREDAGL